MADKAESAQAGDKNAPSQSSENPTPQKELYPMVGWKYDLFLYVLGNLVNLFFRECVPRGSWRVPQTGPVLFVAAPHANQVCKHFFVLVGNEYV
jgi:glycerol-3-phosphate O-acyltransferase/dihydroxyacetone phosphate acyltransferase